MKDLINDYVLSTWPHNHNIDGDDGVDDEEEEEEYEVSQKKMTYRMLLEPWCTGSIISGLPPLGLEMEALNFGYDFFYY